MASVLPWIRKATPGLLLAAATGVFVSCAGGGGNVNTPQRNAIGDRHAHFMRVVAHAKTLPPGRHPYTELPPELRLKNLLTVHVDPRKAYALEFPSHPIDSNPIYVFVEEGVPDPEGVVRAMCSERGAWHFSRQLDEPGWYYAHGP